MSIECRQVSRKYGVEALIATREVAMDFQIKLFNWQDKGNHLIILARGAMDRVAFRQLFDKIETTTQDLSECKVLVDLSDSTYEIDDPEIEAFVAELPLDSWPRGNKVAIVSTPEISGCHRLYFLAHCACGAGVGDRNFS
jgi:hypothetical protein